MEFPGCQQLRLGTPNAGGSRFDPGQGPKITAFHTMQPEIKKKEKEEEDNKAQWEIKLCVKGDISIKFMRVKVKGG